MGLRKSLVFIGSVLVLAACDRAGSPTAPISLHDGVAASARKNTAGTQEDTTANKMFLVDDGCIWVRNGETPDSSLVCPVLY